MAIYTETIFSRTLLASNAGDELFSTMDPTTSFIPEKALSAVPFPLGLPVNIEETLRASISGLSTGDAVNSFTGYLATLFVYELPFNGERLSDVGKLR